jgi:hypothetical protein
MRHCDDLDSVRQLAVKHAGRIWRNPTSSDRFLSEWPSLGMALNPLFRFADRIQKGLSQFRLVLIVILRGFGQFDLSNA